MGYRIRAGLTESGTRRDQVLLGTRVPPATGIVGSAPDLEANGRPPALAQARSSIRPKAVHRRLGCVFGSALGAELGTSVEQLSKSSDRRAPRSSIIAQLGGVALLAESHPRHPVIGDWSGRSAGRATVLMGDRPTGRLELIQGSTLPAGQPCCYRLSSCGDPALRRRLGGEQPPIAGDAVEEPQP